MALAVPAHLDRVHAALHRFWEAVDRAPVPHPASSTRVEFEIGVAEIAANIVRHAYPASAHSTGEFELRIRLYADRLVALLSDRGMPFVERGAHIDLGDGELRERGHGLALARRALDHVEYSRSAEGLNCWCLVKHI